MKSNRSLVVLITLLLLMITACTPASKKKVLIVGGGSSHDFDRWFNQEDAGTLRTAGYEVEYTDDPSTVHPALGNIDLLYLSNNQPLTDPALRQAIFDFADAGKGLLLIHPSVWYNWQDWPEYNQQLVGGGSQSHGPYGPFEITVTDTAHPITAGIPESFTLEDELYRFEIHPEGPALNMLMAGTEPDTGTQFPLVWTVNHPTRRIVGITLGHDGYTHQSEEYKTLLKNSAAWLLN